MAIAYSRKNRLIAGLFFMLFAWGIFDLKAQDFPTDPTQFYTAFDKFMLEGQNSKEMKDFMKEFEVLWKEGPFDVYKKQVIDFCNELKRKKYLAGTHFKPYIQAVMDFYNCQKPKVQFDMWEKGLLWMVKKKSGTYLVNYLEYSSDLFKYNALYKSAGHTWFSESNAWNLGFEEEKVVVKYSSINLKCIGKDDSTLIENTTGIYYPQDEMFYGKGGRVYWTRLNIPKTEVYADLNNYQFSVKRSTFTADSVKFVNTNYSSAPLLGRLEEKLTNRVEGDDSRYPKFDSYLKRFPIQNIVDGVDYDGGFSFYGNKFIAKGDSVNLAQFTFLREGKVFMKVASKTFSVDDDKFSSARASLIMYVGEQDSIYHPGLEFKYLKEQKEVSLVRIGEGTVQSPFYDSFHKLQWFVDALYWKTNETLIRISSIKGAAEGNAKFRSDLYFSELEYERMQGLDEQHPLVKLNLFLRDKNNNQKTFRAVDYAKYIKADLTQAKQLLMTFSIAGLISYNIDTEIGVVTDRFYHAINSNARRTDYDVIEFMSRVGQNQENAKLSLMDYRLDLKGVNNVIISDSQQVEIFPYQREVVIFKDLDFKFNGIIAAGKSAIHGSNFNFFYKDFKFKMKDVQKVEFVVNAFKKNEYGVYDTVNVKSIIEDLSGELLVDHPGNKSGLKSKDFPQYPSLISNKTSYVFYEYPSVEKGVYKKDRFYFALDPFRTDTLDKFQTTSLRYKGTFVSDGIFEDLREELKVMEDYSFGFFKKIDKGGLDIYGGKGKYNDTLTLSHKGLRGAGRLDYLTSQAWSRDFKFYPDSTNTMAYKFGIKKTKGGIETPDVKAKDVYIHWEPQKEKFDVKETGNAFEMYEGQSVMHGKLTLTPSGLQGDGLLSQKNADFESDIFRFRSDEFKADTMKFVLKNVVQEDASDTAQVAMRTDNVRGDVTYIERKASLKTNSKESFVDFPINKFKAYMEELEWFMDQGKVDMNSGMVDELGLKGALFVSTDPRLDSLSFVAPNARFVTAGKTIYCENVKYIDVADSRLFPPDNKINIRRGGKIDPFKGAEIWVGKTDKIHVLKNADVTVYTSKKYSGSADYTYVDEIGTAQVIRLTQLDVDEKYITIGEGFIEQIADFQMSPHFGFKGRVNLYGTNRFLTFRGYTRINHTCKNMKNQWIKFENEIDPNNIMIPIAKEPENDENNKIFNGFLFASDSTGIYPAVLASKIRYSDYEVLNVHGFLQFDKRSQEFRISRKEKLQDRELPGSYLAFNAGNCSSYGEGQMELGSKLGQVSLKCAGTIVHEPADDNISMDILLTVNFKMDVGMFKFMDEKVKSVGATGASLSDEINRKAIVELLDSARAEKIFSNLNTDGKFKRIPKELDKSLVLTDIHLKWDKKQRSLLHSGPVGILIFNGNQVNKSANAMIELNRKSSGDIMTIYLEFDDSNWYYFHYRNNVMQIYSGIKEFNDILTTLESNKRQFQQEGLPLYQITPGTQRRVDKFKEQFENKE